MPIAPVIRRGGNTRGLMYYLVGPGRANEHTYPHLVAGDAMFELLYAGQELSHAAAGEIGKMIDTPMIAHGVRSRGKYKKFDPEIETDYEVVSDNHVFHCSIAQPPDEEPLSEDTWAAIAHEFMDKMGFTEASGKAPCRWVAIHHGETKKGGDHIHIVANIVREDGTKWTQFRDYQLAQKIANELEHKHGLRVLESRERSRYAQADSAQALNEAAKRGQPLTERSQLETRIRAAATAAGTEAQFVELLTQAGVYVRPRFASGRTDVVAGYSVALPAAQGEKPQWFGAGQVARDLALPRLRDRWESSPERAREAVSAWTKHWNSGPTKIRLAQRSTMEQWRGNVQGLSTTLNALSQIDASNPARLADATADVAGLLSAMALKNDGTPFGDALHYTALQVGKHAQLKERPPSANRASPWVTLAGQLMFTAATASSSRSVDLLLAMQILRLSSVLADLYRQEKQTYTAYMIERDTHQMWKSIHRQFTPAETALFEQLAGVQVPEPKTPQLPYAPIDGPATQEASRILREREPVAVQAPAYGSRLPGIGGPVDLTTKPTTGIRRPGQSSAPPGRRLSTIW